MIIKKDFAPIATNFSQRHTACTGCGMIVAAKLLFDTLGPKTIATNATGCSEVTTSQYPNTFFKVPWMHSLFENAAPVASGILAALRYQQKDQGINVVAIGGDGATFDIGLAHISGMWERGDNILYVCYDNEAYQNTGYQSSGATPLDANTTTTPVGTKSWGAKQNKKDMIKIALAHQLPYIATATTGYAADLVAKVKRAISFSGPKYLQIYCPCVPGWGVEPADTLAVAQLAVQSGFYPIVEYVNGQLAGAMKITNLKPVTDFLRLQKRFKHLFKDDIGQQEIKKIQALADANIKNFKLK